MPCGDDIETDQGDETDVRFDLCLRVMSYSAQNTHKRRFDGTWDQIFLHSQILVFAGEVTRSALSQLYLWQQML